MHAVILAAGEGTRMRPLSHSTPKPLLSVAERPLVGHVVDAAVEAGADSLVLVVGDDGDRFRAHFGDAVRGTPVAYAHQDPPDGTADAVRQALPHLEGTFAVLNGDNLYDVESLQRLFSNGPAVGVHGVADPTAYGVVRTKAGRVVDIVEKPADPPTNLANAGAYVFPAAAADWLEVPRSERGEFELTDVLARVVERIGVAPVEIERWLDVGRPWELLAANEVVMEDVEGRVEGTVADSATIGDDVVVAAGAEIRPQSVLEGPTVVRSGATVGPNARLRGSTLLDPGATVGHGAEVKNSVLLADSAVPHLSYVGDSVLGPGVNLGAGTTVANLRHDEAPVHLTVKDERVSTGRRKFGVVLGEGVRTGVNTSFAPGVTLSPGATTAPGEVVRRDR